MKQGSELDSLENPVVYKAIRLFTTSFKPLKNLVGVLLSFRTMKLRDWLFLFSFLVGPLISLVMVGTKMFSTYLPVGDDPGIWLKRVNAFAGVTFPLWDENILTYPPLFHLLGAIFSLIVGDRVVGMKILTLLIFFMVPVITGWLVYKITKNRLAAAAASFLSSFLPMHYEMIWWGAYPNLLGFAMFPLAVYLVIRALDLKYSYKNLAYLVTATFILTMTHHITAVAFAGMLIILSMLLLLIKGVTIKFLIGSISSVLLTTSYVAYLMLAGYMTDNPTVAIVDLYQKFIWGFKSEIVAYILILSSIVGLSLLIFSKKYHVTMVLFAWIASPILVASSQFFGVGLDVGRLMLFLGIPLVVSSCLVIPSLNNLLKLTRKIPEKAYSVEINIERVVPAIMIATAISLAPIISATTNEAAYQYYHWLSTDMGAYSIEEKKQVLDWIQYNTEINDVIVSGYHIGRGVEGYAGRRALMDMQLGTIAVRQEFYRSLTARTILFSNYAVANGYFLVFDQSPLSPTFAPLIHVSTEWGYDPIIYLDDSFVRFKFVRGGKEWIEAPFKSWLNKFDPEETSNSKKYRLVYRSVALEINKTLEIVPYSQFFTLKYDVRPHVDAEMKEAQLSFFLAWEKAVKNFEPLANGFRLSTYQSEIIVEFNKNITTVKGEVYPEFNQYRVYVTLPLRPSGDSFTIIFKNPNPIDSYPRNWSQYFSKALSEFAPKYVVVHKQHVFHKTRSWTPPYVNGKVVHIKDSLVRVNFSKGGALWVEAPYKGKVLEENDLPDGKSVVYETEGLKIFKEVKKEAEGISVRYLVEPKVGVELKHLEIPIWISEGTVVSYVKSLRNQAVIVSSNGSILVESHDDSEMSFGLDQEFNAPRILITKAAYNNKIEVSFTIKPLNYLSYVTYEYLSTTRPLMKDGDIMDIINKPIAFTIVYQTEHLVIYRIDYTAPKQS